MSAPLRLDDTDSGSLKVGLTGGTDLWSYTFVPETPAKESTRPYVHPLYSIDGDVLTNLRPNDHPWHHGLSFMLTSVNGVNFWGGPTHRAADSYQWRSDHGFQRHVEWLVRTPERLVHRLEWCDSQDGETVMIQEERTLTTTVLEDGWRLGWTSKLHNPGSTDLVCGNYHSIGGLEGSHYTGLQFRGARGLLDQHGDDTIRLLGESGSSELEALHGHSAKWLEWHVQADGSLLRSRIRFESRSGSIPWFVRPNDPLVAFAPHRESPLTISAGDTMEFDHVLHFLRV
ncbi:MAG: PmoA family protein [Opitutaceae bacterium]